MHFVIGVIRLLVGLGTLGAMLLAAAALLGFVVPFFDLFNHLQLLLFLGLLTSMVLTVPLFLRSRWQRPVLVLSLVGLVASGITVVPEAVAGFAARPALPDDGRPVLKVMTHNVFGLNYDMQRVNAVILAEDPDIVVLQEYFDEQEVDLHPLLSERYPHFVRCRGGKRANLGLYSKRPFDQAMGAGDCPEDANGSQRTAHILAAFTLADGSTFSLMTTHVDWPLPLERQQAQLKVLAEAAKAVKGPLVVVGDFNSTPWSYALKGFAAETGMERQDFNLVTFPLVFTVPDEWSRRGLIDTIPFLPLDHVFTRNGVAVHELHLGEATGSDHLPIVFSLSVSPTP